MKTTLKLLALIAISFLITAGKPSGGSTSTGWTATGLGHGTVPTTQGAGDVVTMQFPVTNDKQQTVSFLTEPLTTNLTGKTISTTISISYTGNPVFYGAYPGPGSCTNVLRTANANEYQYWWADFAWVGLSASLSGTLTASLDPSQWSDSQGRSGTYNLAAFNAAIANVHQLGFGLGSGCFFDTGVGVVNNSGVATLHVQSFTVQ